MIFRPELVRQISAGRKTQTRRLVKGDEPRSRYQAGKTYAVQPGRGKPASFRILITDVRRDLAGAITLEAAIAEGFRTTDDFKAYWVHLHEPAWVARCEENRNGEPMTTFDLVERFNARHARKFVWVLTFDIDRTETPRLLAARPCPDYVTNVARALPHEPEAVDQTAQDRITTNAGQTTIHWQQLEQGHRDQYLRALSIEQRMIAARLAANRNQVSLSREFHLVRTRIRQGAGQGSIIKLLERAELKAYRRAA